MKGNIKEMFKDIRPNPLYLEFLDKLDDLSECPARHRRCMRGMLFTYDGEIEIANSYEPGEVNCPAVNEDCSYTKFDRSNKWKRFMQHIEHEDFCEVQDIIATKASDWLHSIGYKKRSITFLMGGTGVGKSFAVAEHLFSLYGDAAYKRFITWYQARDLFSAFVNSRDTMEMKGIIVIDDLGTEPQRAEYGAGTNSSVFDAIIDEMIRKSATAYITTNLSPLEMRERYGERARSRIRGSGRILSIPSDEKDMRDA